jgi:hypothetical protein
MPKLKISNSSNGRVFDTLTGVLVPVVLAGVATSDTAGEKHIITVNSTAGVYRGMSIRAKNVPPGSVVNAVISSTKLELFRSAWNATTGVYSHSAANAEATAAATGGTGHALAFDPQALVCQTYIEGTWRNLHSRESKMWYYTTSGTGNEKGFGPGVSLVPSTLTVSAGQATMTAADIVPSDDLNAMPVKRQDGEPHTCLLVVHTGGMLSVIHQPHLKNVTYAGAD